MSIGVITGKFAPLHSGHIYAITNSATQVDKLFVVLSYDEKFVKSLPEKIQPKLTKEKRLLWLKTAFKDMEHIEVVCIDESNIKSYPDGVEEWSLLVKKELSNYTSDPITHWFSSEPSYSWWIEQYFGCTHVIIDSGRSFFPINATEIRKNPYKHWQYLPSIVRKEFLIKICLIGTESCGKTSLTKYLAKMFNTSWVEEYGRKYCEDDMCMDETLLSFNDYAIIASTRYYEELQSENTANKILFVDTNAFVTQFYCNLYEGSPNPLVEAYIQQEHYDIILHLDSDVKWVDDGLRINLDREKTDKLFNEMLEDYNIQNKNDYYKISGNYQTRLTKAINIVNQYIKDYYV